MEKAVSEKIVNLAEKADNVAGFIEAAKYISERIDRIQCGIYDCNDIFGDYKNERYILDGNVLIQFCYCHEYVEVIGLSNSDFRLISEFYAFMVGFYRENSNLSEI